MVARVAAVEPFVGAANLLADLAGLRLSAKRVERAAEADGQAEAVALAAQSPEILGRAAQCAAPTGSRTCSTWKSRHRGAGRRGRRYQRWQWSASAWVRFVGSPVGAPCEVFDEIAGYYGLDHGEVVIDGYGRADLFDQAECVGRPDSGGLMEDHRGLQ